jgi:protein-tyrosine-phosphatase
VFDEICLRNTNTEEMTKEMLTRYPNKNIIVYGDSAGSSRTTAGKSDYAIMAQLGLKNHTLKKANPFVKDRVNAMNAMLCNARGERKIFINPIKCVELVKDCKGVVWKNNDIDKRDINRTHSSDAFGYYIEHEFSLNKKVRTQQRFLK